MAISNRNVLGSFGGHLMATNRLGMAVCCLASAGTFSTLHTKTGDQLLASPATSVPCIPGQEQNGEQCVASSPMIHIDGAPAFACLTSRGTFGDRLVAGVCADKVVMAADGAPHGESTNTTTQPTIR